MTTEQLPDGLNAAVANIEELRGIIAARYADHEGRVHPSRVDRTAREVADCDAAIDAIRAEHHQRVTLQHHAADLAQRVADLEAERDELRARLAEIEAQEPVAISKAGNLFWAGNPQDWRGVDCSLFTRPVPAQAVPDEQAVRTGFRAYDGSGWAATATPWQIWRDAVKWADGHNAAPEHKA